MRNKTNECVCVCVCFIFVIYQLNNQNCFWLDRKISSTFLYKRLPRCRTTIQMNLILNCTETNTLNICLFLFKSSQLSWLESSEWESRWVLRGLRRGKLSESGHPPTGEMNPGNRGQKHVNHEWLLGWCSAHWYACLCWYLWWGFGMRREQMIQPSTTAVFISQSLPKWATGQRGSIYLPLSLSSTESTIYLAGIW